jgi:hypothetical protein
MCALCGVLGGAEHWTDAAARRRERAHRVAGANRIVRHYGLALADWQGAAFVLSTRTGRSEMVESVAHLWPAAERLLGRPCDPLDEGLIARLEADRG